MRPPSPHSTFFSSLKQVEKRLKLDTPTKSIDSSPAPINTQTNHMLTESLGTPMFIYNDIEPNIHSSNAPQDSSEPPLAFLSSSSQSPPFHQTLAQNFPEKQPNTIGIEATANGVDEIDLLMRLLGLSNNGRGEQNEEEGAGGKEKVSDECCGCESGFYEKIVGVKGPKGTKETKRLDGWISYFLQSAAGYGGEGRTKTLSLGYLLLGKAACELGDGGLDFPSAIEEFLKNDPPIG